VDQRIRRFAQDLVLKAQIPVLALDAAQSRTHLSDLGDQFEICGRGSRVIRSVVHDRTLSWSVRRRR
jgi:hypothetical protein